MAKATPKQHELAMALILSIGHALKSTHHYALDGHELTSVQEVLEALKRDGQVVLKRKE